LQDKPHNECTNNTLQIFHISGDHWLCATTIGTPGKKVLVYDSGYTKWDEEILTLLKKQFHCSPSNICVLKDVQKQQECGLYAISIMSSALHLEKTLVR